MFWNTQILSSDLNHDSVSFSWHGSVSYISDKLTQYKGSRNLWHYWIVQVMSLARTNDNHKGLVTWRVSQGTEDLSIERLVKGWEHASCKNMYVQRCQSSGKLLVSGDFVQFILCKKKRRLCMFRKFLFMSGNFDQIHSHLRVLHCTDCKKQYHIQTMWYLENWLD